MDTKQLAMKKYGWLAHYVTDYDDQSPTGFNAHTHGFEVTYQHPNIQIVIPMPPHIAHGIFWNIANRMKAGDRFEPGKRYDKVIRNFDVEFIEAEECGRKVLRMIFPAKDGILGKDRMADKAFVKQYD